jgi:lathosterol oxidase
LLAQLLGLPENPFVTFLTLSIGGLVAFFTLASLSYFFFFVWRRETFHPEYEADAKSNRTAMLWSVASVFGNAALIAPIHWLIATGHGKVYWSVAEHGWGWLFASVGLMLVFTETLIYWIHRALHGDFLYSKLHHTHHQWRSSTPFVGLAFNPLDSFVQGLPHHLFAFLFPIHGVVYLMSVSFVTVWAVMIHDRVSFVRWPFLNNTGHHTLHHWYSDYNFGQYTTFWDRLCGTWKSPFVGCEDVPPGVLAEAAWAANDEERAGAVQPAA